MAGFKLYKTTVYALYTSLQKIIRAELSLYLPSDFSIVHKEHRIHAAHSPVTKIIQLLQNLQIQCNVIQHLGM